MLLSNYGRDKKKGKNPSKKVRKKDRVLGRTTPCVKPKTSRQYIALKSEEYFVLHSPWIFIHFQGFSMYITYVLYFPYSAIAFFRCFISPKKKKKFEFLLFMYSLTPKCTIRLLGHPLYTLKNLTCMNITQL